MTENCNLIIHHNSVRKNKDDYTVSESDSTEKYMYVHSFTHELDFIRMKVVTISTIIEGHIPHVNTIF
jgi:hypothetical protein